MLRIRHRAIDRWARVLLVVAGASLMAESRAQAACGDHTFFSFNVFSQEVTSSTPRRAAAQTAFAASGRALPCGQCPDTPTPEPCRGPSCSGQNGLPTTTTTATTYRESQSTALAGLRTASMMPEGDAWACASDRFEPISSTDPIFHPPRVG